MVLRFATVKNNETSNVLQYSVNDRTNFTQQSKKRHVATKQVALEVFNYFSTRKRDGPFYNTKLLTARRARF